MTPELYFALGLVSALVLAAGFFILWGMYVFMRDLITEELDAKQDGRSHSKGYVRLQVVGACAWFALAVGLMVLLLVFLGQLVSSLLGLD